MIPLALALREDADGGCAPRRSRRPIRPSPRRWRTDSVDDNGADRAGDRRRLRPSAAATRGTAAATAPPTASRAPAAQAVAVAEPVCAGRYTVIFNDYWNRFPKTSGASVRGVAGSQPRHARQSAVRRRRAVHPARRSARHATASHHGGAGGHRSPDDPGGRPDAGTCDDGRSGRDARPDGGVGRDPTSGPDRHPHPHADTRAIAADPGRSGRCRDDHPRGVAGRARGTGADDRPARELVAPRGLQRDMLLRVVPDPFPGEPAAFLATLGITSADQLRDARTNATAAYAMYQQSGWTPWRTTDPG